MKNKSSKIYAIYKNNNHLGNERGNSETDAIKSYLIASNLKESISNQKQISEYSAILAINGIHHYFIKNRF
ncbi:hypothetical protein [Thalassobellus citreus]|uniref:hypothetical protein n=1 Tax=Thalassobellus citreus TaxID=3367752 RepID=UPI0037B275D9